MGRTKQEMVSDESILRAAIHPRYTRKEPTAVGPVGEIERSSRSIECGHGVACCESFGAETQRPPDYFGGSRAVSLAVSFSRHSVDLRVRCCDTDAQDLA